MTLPIKLYTGRCLCGNIGFEIQQANIPILYRCFCSLCRKQSGTDSNAAILINAANFKWKTSVDGISAFVKETGFSNHFCKSCGSAVPNALSKKPNIIWVPVGLIEQDFVVEQVLEFCVNSKVSWTKTKDVVEKHAYAELPTWNELAEKFNLD